MSATEHRAPRGPGGSAPRGPGASARRRATHVALVALAAAGCLVLAWWQWTRFESSSGTFQNLGYALQWPLFACFCVYGYRTFAGYGDSPPVSRSDALTEVPDGLLPQRPPPAAVPAEADAREDASGEAASEDAALRTYNRYLAELATADHQRQDTSRP